MPDAHTTEPRQVGITHPANLLTLARLLFAPLLFWFVLDAEATGGRRGLHSALVSHSQVPISSTVASLAAPTSSVEVAPFSTRSPTRSPSSVVRTAWSTSSGTGGYLSPSLPFANSGSPHGEVDGLVKVSRCQLERLRSTRRSSRAAPCCWQYSRLCANRKRSSTPPCGSPCCGPSSPVSST